MSIESLSRKIQALQRRRERLNDKESPPGREDFARKCRRIAAMTEVIDKMWRERAELLKARRAEC